MPGHIGSYQAWFTFQIWATHQVNLQVLCGGDAGTLAWYHQLDLDGERRGCGRMGRQMIEQIDSWMEPSFSSLNTQHRLLVHLPVLFFSLFSLSFFHYLSLSFFLSLYLFSFSLSLSLYVRVKESKRNRIDPLSPPVASSSLSVIL